MQFCVLTFHIFKLPCEAEASILSSELRARQRISDRWPGMSTEKIRLYSGGSSLLSFLSEVDMLYTSAWLFDVAARNDIDFPDFPPAQSIDRTFPPVRTIRYGTKTSVMATEDMSIPSS